MANKYLTFFLLLTAFCWLIFSSWKPGIESYIVQGKVQAINGSTAQAKIRYTQDKHNFNLEKMPSIDVTANGEFSGVINIAPHGPVYFFVEKEGYTPIRTIKSLNNLEGPNDIGSITISSLYTPPSYRQMQDEEYLPKLNLYEDICLNHLDTETPVNKIAYFEDLRRSDSCLEDPKTVVLSARINISGRAGKTAFFKLKKHQNGEAYIITEEPSSSPVSPAAPAKEDVFSEVRKYN